MTCDGVAGSAIDLKPGMRIQVTTKEGAKNVAIGVEALDKNERFDKRDRDPRLPIATAQPLFRHSFALFKAGGL